MKRPTPKEIEELEIALLLDAVYKLYGYDFRSYAPSSLQRRIDKCVRDEGLMTISGLQDRVIHDPECMIRFLTVMSVDVTGMFRDPEFFEVLRKRVIPILKELRFFRIWLVGCASGEEVYSMAIILEESGLLDRCKLYATDINPLLIERGRSGIFPLEEMKKHNKNYILSGGHKSFSSYYTARYGSVIFNTALKRNVVWGVHNLVSDGSFNEFNLILCRNVMIYFNDELQNRVHNLIYDSLANNGILGLGAKELLSYTSHQDDYDTFDAVQKLYRKIR